MSQSSFCCVAHSLLPLSPDRPAVSCFFFFFSSRRRNTRYWRDWSSDVCSSDLCVLRIFSFTFCITIIVILSFSLWFISIFHCVCVRVFSKHFHLLIGKMSTKIRKVQKLYEACATLSTIDRKSVV